MKTFMRRIRRKEHKIFDSVIGTVIIHMVNYFRAFKFSLKNRFYNLSMIKLCSSYHIAITPFPRISYGLIHGFIKAFCATKFSTTLFYVRGTCHKNLATFASTRNFCSLKYPPTFITTKLSFSNFYMRWLCFKWGITYYAVSNHVDIIT